MSEPARNLVRYIDVVFVAIGAAIAIPLGAPVLGYAIGAGTWLLQRVLQEADRRWIAKIGKPIRRLGYTLFEAFGRIWLLAAGIIVAAGLIILCAYTVAFVVRLSSGRPQGQPAQ